MEMSWLPRYAEESRNFRGCGEPVSDAMTRWRFVMTLGVNPLELAGMEPHQVSIIGTVFHGKRPRPPANQGQAPKNSVGCHQGSQSPLAVPPRQPLVRPRLGRHWHRPVVSCRRTAAVPIRWVLIRDPKGEFEPKALLAIDRTACVAQVQATLQDAVEQIGRILAPADADGDPSGPTPFNCVVALAPNCSRGRRCVLGLR
jgi:hypothetical protein